MIDHLEGGGGEGRGEVGRLKGSGFSEAAEFWGTKSKGQRVVGEKFFITTIQTQGLTDRLTQTQTKARTFSETQTLKDAQILRQIHLQLKPAIPDPTVTNAGFGFF